MTVTIKAPSWARDIQRFGMAFLMDSEIPEEIELVSQLVKTKAEAVRRRILLNFFMRSSD
jgi:hypothetical protein